MKINVSFINGSDYWRNKVLASAKRASEVMSDPVFLASVAKHHGFDFTQMTPADVSHVIENAGEVTIKVGFYKGWWWSKAIAYEENGEIWFNTRKDGYGAGDVGNVAHETLHKMGFSHNGNSASGNGNTVPYWVGEQVALWPVREPVCKVEVVT